MLDKLVEKEKSLNGQAYNENNTEQKKEKKMRSWLIMKTTKILSMEVRRWLKICWTPRNLLELKLKKFCCWKFNKHN